jgi:hypothetical protein
MQSFIKKITDWMIEKEEELAKKCAIPMEEIEYQLAKVQTQKQKIQQEYDEAMKNLNEVEQKLQKIKNIEVLRCQEKKSV